MYANVFFFRKVFEKLATFLTIVQGFSDVKYCYTAAFLYTHNLHPDYSDFSLYDPRHMRI